MCRLDEARAVDTEQLGNRIMPEWQEDLAEQRGGRYPGRDSTPDLVAHQSLALPTVATLHSKLKTCTRANTRVKSSTWPAQGASPGFRRTRLLLRPQPSGEYLGECRRRSKGRITTWRKGDPAAPKNTVLFNAQKPSRLPDEAAQVYGIHYNPVEPLSARLSPSIRFRRESHGR